MYSTIGNISYISGDFGKYSNSDLSASKKYGKNAASNFRTYLQNYTQPKTELDCQSDKFESQIEQLKKAEDKRTPVNFLMQYMPAGKRKGAEVDKEALLAMAEEEMGCSEISVEDLDKKLNKKAPKDKRITSKALDVNGDGIIKPNEYCLSILLADALSKNTKKLTVKNINGIINPQGQEFMLKHYAHENQIPTAKRLFGFLNKRYNLGEETIQ